MPIQSKTSRILPKIWLRGGALRHAAEELPHRGVREHLGLGLQVLDGPDHLPKAAESWRQLALLQLCCFLFAKNEHHIRARFFKARICIENPVAEEKDGGKGQETDEEKSVRRRSRNRKEKWNLMKFQNHYVTGIAKALLSTLTLRGES